MQMVLHVEDTVFDVENVFTDKHFDFRRVIRQHEIVQFQIAFGSAEMNPLLVLSQERIVKAGRNSAWENQFGTKLAGHWRGAGFALKRCECPCADFDRHLSLENP